ncbi:MAG TPA: right-handed parallel beta-helix repeat-containing protein [Candidatus Binatia bacterium]|nr:right-handed parallel beta-helix repeat-containing protein [Candidatus Binatia bacterium]
MKRSHMGVAGAAALALVLTAATADAATVSAETFFATCNAPIFVLEDTIVTGKAEVATGCTVSVEPGIELELQRAKLSFGGTFNVWGNGERVAVTNSKIVASEIVIDARDLMVISGSKLQATAGRINLPPRDNMTVELSTLEATGDVVLGGQGGARNVVSSKLIAGANINIAQGGIGYTGTQSSTAITDSQLAAEGTITVGGFTSHTIVDSTFVSNFDTGNTSSRAIVLASSGTSDGEIRRTSLTAPAGSIRIGANDFVSFEDVDIEAGAPGSTFYSDGAVSIAPDGTSATGLRIQAELGSVHLGGFGAFSCTDCDIDAGGTNNENQAIRIGPFSNVTLVDGKLRARAGGMLIGGSSAVTLTDVKAQAEGAANSGDGIVIGPNGTQNLTRVQLKVEDGRIKVTGGGAGSITESKIKDKSEDGVLLTGSGGMTVTDSQVSSKAGNVTAPNGGGNTFDGNKIKSGGAEGFRVESGSGATSVLENQVKADNAFLRSFSGGTVAAGNQFSVDGVIEVSSSGSCLSVANDPDAPCN